MKILTSTFAFCTVVLSTTFFPGRIPQPAISGAPQADKLVYADFDTIKDGRPVSARGGWVQLQSQLNLTGADTAEAATDIARSARDSAGAGADKWKRWLVTPKTAAGISEFVVT